MAAVELISNIGRVISKHLKALGEFIKEFLNRAEHPITGFSLWLGIFSILLTIHAEVFEHERDPYQSILRKTYYQLMNPTPAPVKLSSLLQLPGQDTPPVSGQDPTVNTKQQSSIPAGINPVSISDGNLQTQSQVSGAASQNRKPPLYVFAFDVSKSMTEQYVSKRALEEYTKNVNSLGTPDGDAYLPPCFPKETKTRLSNFPFARAELCRYLKLVPENSLVAVWKFGDTSERYFPIPEDKQAKYAVWARDTKDGSHVKNIVLKKMPSIDATSELTDFENLFEQLANVFQEEIEYPEQEVHFIIISDFEHDAGGGSVLKGILKSRKDDPVLVSNSTISAKKIAEKLRRLVRKGKTFHLIEVKGAQQMVCKVLPIVTETLEIFTYRATQLLPESSGKDTGFLRPTDQSNEEITFFFTPGNFQPHPLVINFDRAEFADTTLQLNLVAETGGIESQPLKIQSKYTKEGNLRKDYESKSDINGEILRPDGGVESYTISSRNDVIVLRPKSILEPREASNYRLLISWEPNVEARNWDAGRKTYAFRIKFHQRLSRYGVWGILISLALAVICLVWAAYIFLRIFFESKNVKNLLENIWHRLGFGAGLDKNKITARIQDIAEHTGSQHKRQLHKLKSVLVRSDDHEIFYGVLEVFTNPSRPELHFEDQRIAGRLLATICPERPDNDLKQVIRATLMTYNLGIEELPRYLAHVYGKEAVLSALTELKGESLSEKECANLEMFEYWIGCWDGIFRRYI